MFPKIKLTLTQCGLLIAISAIIILLVILGFKSAKLKKVLTQLLIRKSEIDTIKLQDKVTNLKNKARNIDEKRKDSAKRYRDYRNSLDE